MDSGVALVIFSSFGAEIADMAAAESEDPVAGVRGATDTVIRRMQLCSVHTSGMCSAGIVNFLAPDSGIFTFLMDSAGLAALFEFAFIAQTQIRTRTAMTPAEHGSLRLHMWLHARLATLVVIAVIAVIAGIGVMVVMILGDESSRAQVWTSLVAVAVLALFWPLVHRNLRRRRALEGAAATITSPRDRP